MSSNDATNGSDISTFPTEIRDLIFDYVILNSSLSELKSFRTCARYFRDRADIYLFRTLHVSASVKSFERLKHVADNDHLNIHVREIVFHRGTFFGHRMVRGGGHMCAREYGDFERWMIQSMGPTTDIMRTSACYEAFVEEVESESLFNRRLSWQDDTRKACKNFPKLEKLTTLYSSNDLHSEYLQRRCGLVHQSSTPSYFAPYEILGACGKDFRPKVLSLEWVNGEDFGSIVTGWDMRKGGPDAVKNKFSQLVNLRLSFSETVNNLEVEGSWDQFIAACVNLKSLTLDFHQFYSSVRDLRDGENFARRLLSLILKQTFNSLEQLSFRYAIMTEHDFISFLHNHVNSLKSLNLDRWPMPVTTQDKPTGSIIRAFHRIGKLPMKRLSSVNLGEAFSSRADGEGWETSNTGQVPVGTLRDRLQLYMCGQLSDFPLPVATNEYFARLDLTTEELEELDERPAKAGIVDSSFRYFRDFDDKGVRQENEEFDTPRRDYPSGPFGQGGEDVSWQ
ncbi:hypothetical protein H2198_000081 [Neophaeococcomyces mojaviensis]|uniref:Uncharacterized protein n=1 Tax=Neophaeococcomyces mojaviensis TaxID=3383035 RepID=A0ACC3ALG2_9EURO|nr:hypothetical protein H2198_000081 [Knufia sp. JES_112]